MRYIPKKMFSVLPDNRSYYHTNDSHILKQDIR